VRNERLAICKACPHYDGKICLVCGCGVTDEPAFLDKLAWAGQRCPVGKW
jgi:hypothetical protein